MRWIVKPVPPTAPNVCIGNCGINGVKQEIRAVYEWGRA